MREQDQQSFDWDRYLKGRGNLDRTIPRNGADLDPYAHGGRWVNHHREGVIRAVHRRRMLHEIVQSVIGEIDYTGTAREDEVWWQLHTLQEENALPEGISADDVYNLFWTNYHNSGEQQ